MTWNISIYSFFVKHEHKNRLINKNQSLIFYLSNVSNSQTYEFIIKLLSRRDLQIVDLYYGTLPLYPSFLYKNTNYQKDDYGAVNNNQKETIIQTLTFDNIH